MLQIVTVTAMLLEGIGLNQDITLLFDAADNVLCNIADVSFTFIS
jgi:hypothetical protein